MAYIGIPPFGQTVRTVTTITANASQTTFTPTGGYLVGYVDVFYNGVKLIVDDDYTATNGITIVLTTAATVNDIVEIVAYMPVSLADTYRMAEADSRFVNATGDTMSGALLFPTGSASAPAITTTGDTNTGIFFPAADTIAFAEGGVESARFDGAGNLLVGTTTTPSGVSNSLTFLDGTNQKSANITVGSIFEYNANVSLPTDVFGRLVTSNTTNDTTLTLPSLSGQTGKVVSISNINTGLVTVVTGASNGGIFGMGVNGGTTIQVPAYSSIQLATDGGNWKALTSNTVSPTTGTAPYYGARAWVNFDGTTSPGTIRASGNVSSVTRNSTGDYNINFTTAMPDANYGTVATVATAGNVTVIRSGTTTYSTTTAQVNCNVASTSAAINPTRVSVSFFR
jgi:hypothetical protein